MGARGTTLYVTRAAEFHFRGGRQVERWIYPEDLDAWNTIFDG